MHLCESRKRAVGSALCALVVFLCPMLLPGQNASGEIRLEIKDPSGAPMEVVGKLVNLASGVSTPFQTDKQGIASIPGVAPGRYRLEVTKTGFRRLLLSSMSRQEHWSRERYRWRSEVNHTKLMWSGSRLFQELTAP